jgi:hypothetical protein
MSWAITGVELCVFATISLFVVCNLWFPGDFEPALAPNTSNNRSLTPDGLQLWRAARLRAETASYEKARETIVEVVTRGRQRCGSRLRGHNALTAED